MDIAIWKKNRGFSLLEVMIAIAVLAVSLMAIFNLQSVSISGSYRSEKVAISTELARLKMAQVILDIEKGIPKGEFPDDKEESGNFEEEKYPDYSWKLTIKKNESPAPQLPEGQSEVLGQIVSIVSEQLNQSSREIHLVVSWKEADEDRVGITLTTHVVKM